MHDTWTGTVWWLTEVISPRRLTRAPPGRTSVASRTKQLDTL